MASRSSLAFGMLGVSLYLLTPLVVGCGKEQAPPPAQTPQSAPAPVATPTQNAARLQIGMTSEQVQKIMGAPGQVEQEGLKLEWKYYTSQGSKVEVKMVNNLVTAIESK